LPIGIHPEGRVVLVYLLVDPWRDEFRSFLQHHVVMLAGLTAWTVKVGLPAHLGGLADQMQKEARAQIAAPLRDVVRDEPRWYFERLREGRSSHRRTQMPNDSSALSEHSKAHDIPCCIEPG
jgi:hypothetical protein